MENFRKIILSTFFLFASLLGFSQEDLVVFKYSGEPFFEVNDSIKSITKGTILDKRAVLTLNKGDEVILVNNDGEPLTIKKSGSYSYSDLNALKPKKIESNLVGRFFSYAWREMTVGTSRRNNKSGVVYRGDEVVLMRFPSDSLRIYLNEISFSWDSIPNKKQSYYLFIKDLNTNELFKKESKDNFLTVKIDESQLEYGTDYKWGISESKFEQFKNLKTFQFRLLSKSEFDDYHKDLRKLIKELKDLGLSEEQAKESICEYSKFCF